MKHLDRKATGLRNHKILTINNNFIWNNDKISKKKLKYPLVIEIRDIINEYHKELLYEESISDKHNSIWKKLAKTLADIITSTELFVNMIDNNNIYHKLYNKFNIESINKNISDIRRNKKLAEDTKTKLISKIIKLGDIIQQRKN